jgi:hypothetical protein
MADQIVGRDAELAAATRALAGSGVLLDGPAGIGKTAIWRRLVEELVAGGTTVLRAAPTEAERLLPYAALADLLRPMAAAMTELPPPQAAAARAVLVSGDTGHPVDERTVAVMVQAVLESAGARERPVIAIDDCQWLDAPSERALRYALRRLDPGPRVLLTLRGDGQDPFPLGLNQDRSINRVAVPALGIGAMHHVLQRHLGATLNRPLLTRLTSESEGNPMLAVELARAVLRLPSLPRPGEDLPVARSVQDLVTTTLRSLPERTLTALRLPRCSPRPHRRTCSPRVSTPPTWTPRKRAAWSRCAVTRGSATRCRPPRFGRVSRTGSAAGCSFAWPRPSPIPMSGPGSWRERSPIRTRRWRPHWRHPGGGSGPGECRAWPPTCWTGPPSSPRPMAPLRGPAGCWRPCAPGTTAGIMPPPRQPRSGWRTPCPVMTRRLPC